MRKLCALSPLALCLATLFAQQPPQPTQLPGDVFTIKNTWFIGGAGPWDYLTMDPSTHRLFIAHGAQVQVVDVESGQLVLKHQGRRVVIADIGSGCWFDLCQNLVDERHRRFDADFLREGVDLGVKTLVVQVGPRSSHPC